MARPKAWPPAVRPFRGQDRCWHNGEYHYLGPMGSSESRANYARLLAAWSSDPGAVLRPAGELLVVELCADYLNSPDAPTGRDQRIRVVRAVELLAELHLTTAAHQFGPVALEEWQGWLCRQVDAKGERRWNRTYIMHLVGAIKSIWKWAIRKQKLPVELYQALCTVPPPKFEQAREAVPVAAANPDHVAATLEHLRTPTAAMVRIQILTGARPGEVVVMRVCDLLRTGRVELPGVGMIDLDAEKVWVYQPAQHKKRHRRKPRFIVLGPQAQAILKQFIDGREPTAYLFDPRQAMRESRADVVRKPGGKGSRKPKKDRPASTPQDRYTTRTYGKAIERAAKLADVPHWHPHQLRHLAAVEIDFASGIDAAQAVLGHDDPNTTRRYAKTSFRAAAQAARAMG